MGFAIRTVRASSAMRGVRWTHVLCLAGAVASLGNLALIRSALGRTDNTGHITVRCVHSSGEGVSPSLAATEAVASPPVATLCDSCVGQEETREGGT